MSDNKQQSAGSRQQTAGSNQQTADSRQHKTADNRQQTDQIHAVDADDHLASHRACFPRHYCMVIVIVMVMMTVTVCVCLRPLSQPYLRGESIL
jgi:hypothetical protein